MSSRSCSNTFADDVADDVALTPAWLYDTQPQEE